MLRIVRSIDAGTTTLTVSGRIGSGQLPELRRFHALQSETLDADDL
jgi:hypothetical protein